MREELQQQITLAESITRLFYPHVEVVIHDVKTNRIAAIFNSYSKRKVGDDSQLTEDELGCLDNILGPYEKVNWDGRALKSITTAIRNDADELLGLFCINFDIEPFQKCQAILEGLIGGNLNTDQPDVLFKDDWQERINNYVTQFVREHGLSLDHLGRQTKKELVIHLHAQGAFEAKNAATYVGRVLSISRATVYKYLKDTVG